MLNVSAGGWEEVVREGERLFGEGKFGEAGEAFLGVLREQPGHVGAMRGLAHAALAAGDFGRAAEMAREVVKRDPGQVNTLMVLGQAALMTGSVEEAVGVYRRLVEVRPGSVPVKVGLGLAYHKAGMVGESVGVLEELLARHGGEKGMEHVGSARLYGMQFLAGVSAGEIAAAHRAWGRGLAGREVAAPAGGWRRRGVGERLRVGYVSPDFRNHSVARFVEPLLRHHDRGRVEVFCYSSGAQVDGVTRGLRGLAEHWREIGGMKDGEAVAAIRGDGVDVLVDLAGHTAGGRLGVFAMRGAAVQVTWLGYPDTTGLETMDWRVVDGVTDPEGSEGLGTEKLLRIGVPFLCFGVVRGLPGVEELPAARDGVVTFGSFNALAKVNAVCVGMWGRVMAGVAGSRMILKAAGLGEGMVKERVWRMFEAAGIGRERVELLGFTGNVLEHLKVYGRVDVGLDTYPYGGTTTTCEALVMGVPVVTRMGDRHASRVGGSLVTAVGHGEWASGTEEGFVSAGIEMARDVGRLARVRGGLRGEVAGSGLGDGAGFARRWEEAMERIVRAG